MKKFMDENVLLNQKYVRDESKTIADLINDKVAALSRAPGCSQNLFAGLG